MNAFIDFFSEKASVRGESQKSQKTRKVKMSRKRVFRKFQIVQGPGFSCKPNTAFFMGYPLYPGSDEMRRVQNTVIDLLSLYFKNLLRVCLDPKRIGGLWRIGAGLPQLERERKGRLTGVKPGNHEIVQGLIS